MIPIAFRSMQLAAFATLLCLALPSAASDDALHIEKATIVVPVKTAPVLAGYATLMNHNHAEVTLNDVSSEAFGRIEIHKTIIENDVAKMQRQETLTIPAHGQVQLERGGLHLMLMQPASTHDAGDQIALEFNFDDGTTQTVTFEVTTLTSSSDAQDSHGQQTHKHNH